MENTSRTGVPNKDTSNYKKEHVYTATADMTINTGESNAATARNPKPPPRAARCSPLIYAAETPGSVENSEDKLENNSRITLVAKVHRGRFV